MSAPLDDHTDAMRRALYSPASTDADVSAYAEVVRLQNPSAVLSSSASDAGSMRPPDAESPRAPRPRVARAVAASVAALALVASGFALGRSVDGTSKPVESATSPAASAATGKGFGGAALVFTRVQVGSDRPDAPLAANVIASSVRRLAEQRSIGVSLYAALQTDGNIALLATTLQQRVISTSAPPPRFAGDGLRLRFTVTTDPIDDAGTGAKTAVTAAWRPDGTVSITPRRL